MAVYDIRLEPKNDEFGWTEIKKIIEEAFKDKKGLHELTLLNVD